MGPYGGDGRPAYAASLTLITDEAYLKASRSVLHAFENTPSPPQILDPVLHRCRELNVRGANTVRLCTASRPCTGMPVLPWEAGRGPCCSRQKKGCPHNMMILPECVGVSGNQ